MRIIRFFPLLAAFFFFSCQGTGGNGGDSADKPNPDPAPQTEQNMEEEQKIRKQLDSFAREYFNYFEDELVLSYLDERESLKSDLDKWIGGETRFGYAFPELTKHFVSQYRKTDFPCPAEANAERSPVSQYMHCMDRIFDCKLEFRRFSVKNVKIDGDEAEAELWVTTDDMDQETACHKTFVLVMENGEWKIDGWKNA